MLELSKQKYINEHPRSENMTPQITPAQDRLYDLILSHYRNQGEEPSQCYLAGRLGLTRGRINDLIMRLRFKGRIEPDSLIPVGLKEEFKKAATNFTPQESLP